MTDGHFPRHQVDEAIDRAVREIMQVDPHPGLRRRVLARLERRAPGAWLRRFRGSFFLLPAAAVIAMVLAIVIPAVRPSAPNVKSAPPAETASRTPRDLPATPALPAPGAAAPQPARPSVSAAPRASIFGERRDRVSASSVQPAIVDAGTFPPAIADDVSLGLARIVITPLAEVREIRVRPIEIQAITLPALSPPR